MNRECRWVWEPRERGLLDRLLFWRKTSPEGRAGMWVPKSGTFARLDEHAELLAADVRERA